MDHEPQPDREIHFVLPTSDQRHWKVADPTKGDLPERKERVLRELGEIRDDALERFEQDTEGLNLERIDQFLDSLGLEPSQVVVVDKSRQGEVLQFLQDEIGLQIVNDDMGGVHVALLDLSFVFRNHANEKLNGPELTETRIVHEKAHASSQYKDVVGKPEGRTTIVDTPRVGHIVKPAPDSEESVGVFLEEGFAEVVRAKYVTDILGLPHGLARLPNEMGTIDVEGSSVPMPNKFSQFSPEGEPALIYNSLAGAALDFLVQRDNLLLPALIKARHDPDGLRDVAFRLNQVRPGFYEELRDNFNDRGRFGNGLKFVADTLGYRQ